MLGHLHPLLAHHLPSSSFYDHNIMLSWLYHDDVMMMSRWCHDDVVMIIWWNDYDVIVMISWYDDMILCQYFIAKTVLTHGSWIKIFVDMYYIIPCKSRPWFWYCDNMIWCYVDKMTIRNKNPHQFQLMDLDKNPHQFQLMDLDMMFWRQENY